MKALIFISEKYNAESAQWQFDRVMALLAYDYEIAVVFIKDGLSQLTKLKSWKSLAIYGVDKVFFMSDDNSCDSSQFPIEIKEIDLDSIRDLIQTAEIII